MAMQFSALISPPFRTPRTSSDRTTTLTVPPQSNGRAASSGRGPLFAENITGVIFKLDISWMECKKSSKAMKLQAVKRNFTSQDIRMEELIGNQLITEVVPAHRASQVIEDKARNSPVTAQHGKMLLNGAWHPQRIT
jgi:hypothetical protein